MRVALINYFNPDIQYNESTFRSGTTIYPIFYRYFIYDKYPSSILIKAKIAIPQIANQYLTELDVANRNFNTICFFVMIIFSFFVYMILKNIFDRINIVTKILTYINSKCKIETIDFESLQSEVVEISAKDEYGSLLNEFYLFITENPQLLKDNLKKSENNIDEVDDIKDIEKSPENPSDNSII
jgi:hypothetical protein